MSLLEEPQDTSSSSRGWLLLITVIVLAAGIIAIFAPRWFSSDKASETADVATDTLETSTPSAPNTKEQKPKPSYLAPKPRATPSVHSETPSALPLLSITSDVDGADVFIDRRFVGKTPYKWFNASPGLHQINVSAPGYNGFSELVDIGDIPTTLNLTFKTIRLDQMIKVVHKHKVGTCEGELVATIEGIRYKSDGDDSFIADFDSLKDFSVDYLDHNLRLTLNAGSTYNFTDNEPNADKLFVFHREVDRVREQLSTSRSE